LGVPVIIDDSEDDDDVITSNTNNIASNIEVTNKEQYHITEKQEKTEKTEKTEKQEKTKNLKKPRIRTLAYSINLWLALLKSNILCFLS